MPTLVYFLSLSQQGAQGTSIAAMLPPIGILAAFNYHKAGAINWKFALIIAATFVLGGYLGSDVDFNVDMQQFAKVERGINPYSAIERVVAPTTTDCVVSGCTEDDVIT